MAITALDTHQTVKDLTAAGFSDSQAEALTQARRQVQQIDLARIPVMLICRLLSWGAAKQRARDL